jgi:hypothetical protein
LYEISRIPQPDATVANDRYRYSQPFRVNYSGVEIIGDETVAILLAALEAVATKPSINERK